MIALDDTLLLPEKHKVYKRPISSEGIGPHFQSKFVLIAVVRGGILDMRLDLPQIELFVKAIQEECEELLRVLLIITLELVTDFREALFKVSRIYNMLLIVHGLNLNKINDD